MANLNEAIDKLKSGKLKEGRKILEEVLKDEPSNVVALYNLGMCYSELGLLDASIEILEQCVGFASQHSNAYTALGFSYSRKGQNEKALENLRKALAIDPENFHALKNCGGVLAKLKQYDEAVECFEKANLIIPDTPEILYGLGLALQEKGDLESADILFKRIVNESKDQTIAELARTTRTEIGMQNLKSKGVRIDAVMYCMNALKLFSSKSKEQVLGIASEIAMLGRTGLDINNPDRKYKLKSLNGEFSGLQLLCYMYVGFQKIDPSMNIGADLSVEYQEAFKLYSSETGADQ